MLKELISGLKVISAMIKKSKFKISKLIPLGCEDKKMIKSLRQEISCFNFLKFTIFIIVNFSVRLMSIKCRFNCYLFKPFLEVWSPPETWSDRIDTYEENRNMGNSLDSQVFGDIARFPGILGILQISQIPVDSRFIIFLECLLIMVNCMIFFTQIHCLSSVIFPWFVF